MGHGDEVVLADAHFPSASVGRRVIRADGLGIAALLDAILPLFELDAYVDAPVAMMAPVPGDALDPAVEASYVRVIAKHAPGTSAPARVERFAFYARAREAFAVVATGDTAKYGNVILRKGVTPLR
jgi:L-fucose mutarotase